MIAAQKKLLRQLVGAYLSRPDPAGWLAAADLYAETCDGGRTCQCKDSPHTCAALAKLWALRGELYPPLLSLYRRSSPSMVGCRHSESVGGRRVDMVRWRGKVMIEYHVGGEPGVFRRHVIDAIGPITMVDPASFPHAHRYLTRRLLGVIDDNARTTFGGGLSRWQDSWPA